MIIDIFLPLLALLTTSLVLPQSAMAVEGVCADNYKPFHADMNFKFNRNPRPWTISLSKAVNEPPPGKESCEIPGYVAAYGISSDKEFKKCFLLLKTKKESIPYDMGCMYVYEEKSMRREIFSINVTCDPKGPIDTVEMGPTVFFRIENGYHHFYISGRSRATCPPSALTTTVPTTLTTTVPTTLTTTLPPSLPEDAPTVQWTIVKVRTTPSQENISESIEKCLARSKYVDDSHAFRVVCPREGGEQNCAIIFKHRYAATWFVGEANNRRVQGVFNAVILDATGTPPSSSGSAKDSNGDNKTKWVAIIVWLVIAILVLLVAVIGIVIVIIVARNKSIPANDGYYSIPHEVAAAIEMNKTDQTILETPE